MQKHAKQLQCDVTSKKFKDTMRYLWIPRLLERIRAASGTCPSPMPAALPACLGGQRQPGHSPESSPPLADSYYSVRAGESSGGKQIPGTESGSGVVQMQSPGGYCNQRLSEFEQCDVRGNLWNLEDIWF